MGIQIFLWQKENLGVQGTQIKFLELVRIEHRFGALNFMRGCMRFHQYM